MLFSWRMPKALTYHTVLPERSGEALFEYAQPSVDEFEEQVRFLRRHCYPLDLGSYLEIVRGRRRGPPNGVLVTFDDGYRHTRLAAAILARNDVPSVLFLATRFVGAVRWSWYLALDWLVENRDADKVRWGGAEWPLDTLARRKVFRDAFKAEFLASTRDRQDDLLSLLADAVGTLLPEEPPESCRFLDWAEVAAIAADGAIEVGSHGVNHVDLTRLSDTDLAREVDDAAGAIHGVTGVEPRAFSYPDGRHDARVRSAVARRHDCAFALIPRSRRSDPMQLPRLPALPDGETAIRRVLGPTFRPRLALWRARARLGLLA